MPTTPNYGWPTPASTDLVKDGATAIQNLGNSADSTVKTVSDAQIPKSLIDAKGDLLVGTADNTVARLAVGANDTVLTADSTQSGGLKWGIIASGGMTLIQSTALSGAGISFTSIPGTYKDLYLVLDDWTIANSATLTVKINNDTSAIYDRVGQQLNDANVASIVSSGNASNVNLTGDTPNSGAAINSTIVRFYNYASANAAKVGDFISCYNMSGTAYGVVNCAWGYASATAITQIDVNLSAFTFSAGTAYLYGVK